MKSYMAKPAEVKREWYVIDATDMPLGRLASQVAAILKGKNKPTYTPNVDTGDYVIVINSDKIILTGKKSVQKYYRHYTGYIGGMKEIRYDKLMDQKSDFALQKAVKGMLPKNVLGRQMIKKLFIYKDDEHPHAAQQPKTLSLN